MPVLIIKKVTPLTTNFLGFNITLGQTKPENIINRDNACPFCDRKHLTHIIDSCDDLLLIENKYNVLENAYQTVLIESHFCDIDIPQYSLAHMQKLLRFGIKHWFSMIDSGKYKTVLFFKNHGPLSGGTIRHPHMQIIGLKSLDDHLMYDADEFQGLVIDATNGVELNISTNPRIGFSEFNIVTNDNSKIDTIAYYVQVAVDYTMLHFNQRCQSYNLFFYLIDGRIHVKVMPRFATSPLFIGYNIRLRSNNLPLIVEEFHRLYFTKR
jgi:hypothetical protein